jgi:hypothetical protein
MPKLRSGSDNELPRAKSTYETQAADQKGKSEAPTREKSPLLLPRGI